MQPGRFLSRPPTRAAALFLALIAQAPPVRSQLTGRSESAAAATLVREAVECTSCAPCGTQVTPENAGVLLTRAASGGRSMPGVTFRIPIALHVVRRSNGTGGLSERALRLSLEDANQYFAQAGIQFCPLEKAIFIDDDSYFGCVCNDEIDALRGERRVEDAVNAYFVPNVMSDGEPLCGLGTLPGTGNSGVIMRNSCTAAGGNPSTLAHELGHFLGLLHTHERFFGVECANGSNCEVSGDLVCDTPADPNLLGRVNAQCRYTGPASGSCPGDPTPLRPLVDNIMSYSRATCRRGFTPGQIERMRTVVVEDRPELARLECPTRDTPSPRELVRVSENAAGQPGNGPSRAPDIAARGGLVAFLSQATNLVSRPVNGTVAQVYVRDLAHKGVELVSHGPDGAPAEDQCSSPRISADGRYVVYCTLSRNLVPEVHGPLGAGNVFRYDVKTRETRLVSRAPDGGGTNAVFQSGTCALSSDARTVAFSSYATNLVPIPELGVSQIYVADLEAGTVELVSVDADGNPGTLWSESPALSPDGRTVVFSSHARLEPRDPDELPDVYLFDRAARTTRLVSIDENGNKGFGNARTPSVSGDGRFVAFELAALGPWKDDLTTIYGDIAVKDLATDVLRRVSETASGTASSFDSDAPALSADGRFVAFRSRANEFHAVPTLLADYDFWLKDLETGALVEASVLAVESFGPARAEISVDARAAAVAFATEASNLVPDDTNGVADVYVRFFPR